MSFRFWRRIKIAPGISINLSKSGASVSFGTKGARFTVGPSGYRATFGLPGTGLFYTQKVGTTKREQSNKLTLGFFKRLITPDNEKSLLNGLRALTLGNDEEAYLCFKDAVHLADAAFLAGFMALKKGDLVDAEKYLILALHNSNQLGNYFNKYGISASMSFSVTDEINATVNPDIVGVLLALVEIYQRQNNHKQAITCLDKLLKLEPNNMLVKLSYVEFLFYAYPSNKDVCKDIIRLTENITNESAIHAALMLYRAKALEELGLTNAAKDLLTQALRKKKNRPIELIHAIRYERAVIYEKLGQKKRARSDFENIYVEAPEYEDVAKRLNIE